MTAVEGSSGSLEQHLHQLRVFLSVAQAKTVTLASRRMFRSHSAVTRSVLELERAIGASLFERWSRGMILNAYGEVVLKRARRIGEEIDQAAGEFVRSVDHGPSPNAVINALFSGRKLRLIIQLADLGHMSAAADHLGLTQAGVSMALSRLETALGQRLFERRLEGMVPTELAERLIVHAKRVLAELRHLRSDLGALSGEITGSVVIGTTPLGRTQPFPAAIAAVIGRYPALQVTAMESSYERLVGGLRSGDVDILFSLLREPHLCQGLVSETVFTDRMAVLVRAGHPLLGRARLQMAELLNEKWILPRAYTPGRPLVEAYFQRLGLAAPFASVQTSDLATVRQLLESSDMLAVASPHQFLFEIRSGLLAELPLTLDGRAIEVGFVVREGALLSPAALAVIEAVRQSAPQRLPGE